MHLFVYSKSLLRSHSLMATDPSQSELSRLGQQDSPQVGDEIELTQVNPAHRPLSGEIEARDSKLAELSDAARKREDELCRELARQSTHLGERISRLERELQDQSVQAAE